MDGTSKRHREVVKEQEQENYNLPPNEHTWSFEHNGARIQRWNRKMVQGLIHSTTLKKYWMTKANAVGQTNKIAWGPIGMAQQTWPFYKTIWLQWWLSNCLPKSYSLQ